MKKFVVVLLVLAAVAAAAWYWQQHRSKPAATESYVYAKAERGTLRLTVASTGRVVSNLDVDIKCKASGEVIAVPFDVSDPVRKDDLLVELDPVDMDRVLKQAGVALSASKARQLIARQNLEVAKLTLETDRKRADAGVKAADAVARNAHAQAERQELLVKTKSGMAADRDAAVANAAKADADVEIARIHQEEIKTEALAIELKKQELALADAAVKSDNITLSIAEDRLADTKVYAPISGVVSSRTVQVGQIISSGITTVGGGTTVLSVSDLSRIYVLASVDESDIGRVKVGQAALIDADAFPGIKFEGEVIRIATRGVNVSNVVTFEVKIEVLGDQKVLLKAEMTANIEITTMEKPDVLLVPVEAVSHAKGDATVRVAVGDNAPVARSVAAGETDGVLIEVLSGLEPGETVVYKKAAPESRWNPSVRPPYIPGGPSPKGK